MDITFINNLEGVDLDIPKPASNYLPDWYKEMDSYLSGKKVPIGNGKGYATIKKCVPVFDAITIGYIIESPADIYVSIQNGAQHFQWADFNLIEFHPIEQAPKHPNVKPYMYPKWMSPWGIKTPKGYSTLFVQPFHRESIFTILPGVVDTDTYMSTVNFPFVINDPDFEGIIPKGTPIAQVIPFKRDSWKSKLGSKKDIEKQKQNTRKLFSLFFDRYKTLYWQRKEYK